MPAQSALLSECIWLRIGERLQLWGLQPAGRAAAGAWRRHIACTHQHALVSISHIGTTLQCAHRCII